MIKSTVSLWLFHLIGNALLLLLGYYWLGVGESDTTNLLWSALVALSGIIIALWIHGTALVYFDPGAEHRLFPALVRTGRNLPPLLAVALCAAILYGFLAYTYGKFEHNSFLIGSYATMRTRKPVAPASVLRWYHVLTWILRWLLFPALLFPLSAAVARSGWAGFRGSSLRRSLSLLYWIEVCILLVVAIVVPLRLLSWIPAFSHFATQMLSFLGRIGIGYLLFVAALLTIEFLTSRGNPRWSQPTTVASP